MLGVVLFSLLYVLVIIMFVLFIVVVVCLVVKRVLSSYSSCADFFKNWSYYAEI